MSRSSHLLHVLPIHSPSTTITIALVPSSTWMLQKFCNSPLHPFRPSSLLHRGQTDIFNYKSDHITPSRLALNILIASYCSSTKDRTLNPLPNLLAFSLATPGSHVHHLFSILGLLHMLLPLPGMLFLELLPTYLLLIIQISATMSLSQIPLF